jgi:hypothetical protein
LGNRGSRVLNRTSLIANLISLVVILLVAVAIGFRSGAGVVAWLAVLGIVVLFTLALTWLSVIAGLAAKSPDGAGAFAYPLLFLPFVSSAFVPTTGMQGTRRSSPPRSRTSIVACGPRSASASATANASPSPLLATGWRGPPDAVDYLGRLRELDVPKRAVEMEPHAWMILVAAQIPDKMPALMALKRAQIEDPAVTAMYLDLDERSAGTPMIHACRLWPTGSTMFEADAGRWSEDQVADFALDDELVALLDDLFVNAMPIARRLPRLVEESGWTGWNKLGRIDSPSSPGTGLTVNVRRTATHERSAADPRAVAMR